MVQSAGFMGLPDEVLLMIVNQLQSYDLYRLATSCKRLNHFVLPIYFESFTQAQDRMKISASSDCHKFCVCSAALHGLSVAFFITALSSASFTYDGTNSRPMRTFQRVIARVKKVSKVTLQISLTELPGWSFGRMSFWRGMKELPGILDALSSKLCSKLRLKGEALTVEDIDVLQLPPPSQIRPLTHLVSFLGEQIAFSPTLKDCIIESLNASPIEKLSLQGLITSEWDDILPRLTLPSLTKLEVGSLDFNANAVFTFLTRHPTVTELTISGTATLRRPTRLSSGLYPRILRLQSNVKTMYHLLGFRANDAFPNVKSIAISSHDQFLDLSVMDLVLDRLIHRDHVSSLSIDLPNALYIIQWLNVHASQYSRRAEGRLRGILSVEINSIWNKETLDAVPRWLGLFPSVQRVSINRMPDGFTVDDEVGFVGAVAEAQPQVESVVTQSNVYHRGSDQNWLPATLVL